MPGEPAVVSSYSWRGDRWHRHPGHPDRTLFYSNDYAVDLVDYEVRDEEEQRVLDRFDFIPTLGFDGDDRYEGANRMVDSRRYAKGRLHVVDGHVAQGDQKRVSFGPTVGQGDCRDGE